MTAVLDLSGAVHRLTLPAVSLPELNLRAALLTRVDRKYLVPTAELATLLDGLPGGTRVLEIDGRRTFGYRSTYLDTPAMDSYLGAARRRRRRYKVRIRGYVDAGEAYTEVKTRGARGTTVKQRVAYHGDGGSLDAAGRAHADSVLAAAGISCETGRLGPTLVTGYHRTTLLLPGTGARVTVDTDLGWSLPDGTTLRTPDRVIVETKSAGAATAVDRLLRSLGHRPCPVSKYGTGLAALRPDLPANRWHHVLRRHFLPACA